MKKIDFINRMKPYELIEVDKVNKNHEMMKVCGVIQIKEMIDLTKAIGVNEVNGVNELNQVNRGNEVNEVNGKMK